MEIIAKHFKDKGGARRIAEAPISRNAHPPRQHRFPLVVYLFLRQMLQPLSFYTAAAITAFGWVVSGWAGLDPTPFALLWAAGALFIYNLDRLSADPADAINVPKRSAEVQRLRRPAFAIMALSVLVLLAIPIWQRDWLLLGLVLLGALLGASYCVPIFGRRTKQIPGLKTLLVPLIVLAAYFVPAATDGNFPRTAQMPLWAFGVLLFNMLLCDLRDRPGDLAAGTKTLPVLLGPRGTHALLALVLLALIPLSPHPAQWLTLAALAALQLAVLRPRSENFYAWLVDGALFLPALGQLGEHLLHRLPI